MPTPSNIRRASILEAKARRLWAARTLSPQSWQNSLASVIWDKAQALRAIANR